jgi:hypothetical protein
MAGWNWLPRFHDPSLRLSLREQVALHWDANLRMLRDWRACWHFTWVSLLPVPLMVAAVLLPAATAFTPHSTAGMACALALLAGYLLLQHVAFTAAMRRFYLPFVRRALTGLGHPTCLDCGHPLGPAPPARCPECGSGRREPR